MFAETEDIGLDLDEDLFAPDSVREAREDSLLALQEAPLEALDDEQLDPDGPQRLPPSRVIKLLALNTSVVTYDFVRVRGQDNWLEGFTTTRLRNQVSSDFLRGLQLSIEHDLFGREDRGGELVRTFDPILTQLNFSFAVNSGSGVIQAIGRLFGGGEDAPPEDSVTALLETDDLDPLLDNVGNISPTDGSSIVPGAGSDDVVGEDPRRVARRAPSGAWNANFSYSLRRSRDSALPASQLLQIGVRLKPTENWDLVWRTSYDIEQNSFLDHTVRLTRDLHRWHQFSQFGKPAPVSGHPCRRPGL